MLTSVASEKVGKCDARRYARTSPLFSSNGYQSSAELQAIPSFQVAAAGPSVQMHSSVSSADILLLRDGRARRFRERQ